MTPFTLSAYTKALTPAITSRAKAYLEEGAVEGFEDAGESVRATVQGTDAYQVELRLEGEQITQALCTCPYDKGFCKHIGAVLMALCASRGIEQQKPKKGVAAQKESLEQLLQEVSKEALTAWLIEYARYNRDLRNALTLRFSKKEKSKNTRTFYEKMVDSYVRSYGDRYRFIDYSKARGFFRQIDQLLKNLEGALAQRNLYEAFHGALGVMVRVDKALLHCDDSDGGGSDTFMGCFALIDGVMEKAGPEFREEMFEQLSKELDKLTSNSFISGLEVIERMARLCVGREQRERLFALADCYAQSSSYGYLAEEVVRIKIALLAQMKEEAQSRALMEANLHLNGVREMAYALLLKEEVPQKALAFCDESIHLAQQKGHAGHVSEWMDRKAQLLQQAGDTAALRPLALSLFLRTHSREHLAAYKALFDTNAWQIERLALLEQLKTPRTLGAAEAFCAEEEMFDALMDLLEQRSDIRSLEHYAPQLLKTHRERLGALYLAFTLKEIHSGKTGRDHYKQCAKWLLALARIPGFKEVVLAQIGELKQTYKHRPTLRAELDELEIKVRIIRE